MSLLVVGLSHLTAPVETLERAVVSGDAHHKLLHDVHSSRNISGALLLSTCNRVEVYAEVDSFHGGVAAIGDLLARHSGLSPVELSRSAYVHYQDRAAQHLLAVACGLESMVVGESQILGQVRQSVRLARQQGTLSRELSDLSRLALRAGRRAHAETDIDAAGQNLVTLGLGLASASRDQAADGLNGLGLNGLSVLVVGAGAMSSLAVATAVRLGATSVRVANRTRLNAERLAEKYGAQAIGFGELDAAMATADLIVTCTGATGHVISASAVAGSLAGRQRGDLVFLDLALPRDVDPAVAGLPGVRLVDMTAIAGAGDGARAGTTAFASDEDIAAVRRIVAQELSSFAKADRAASVAPTVVALRAKAATVVEAELARLDRRLRRLGRADARRNLQVDEQNCGQTAARAYRQS